MNLVTYVPALELGGKVLLVEDDASQSALARELIEGESHGSVDVIDAPSLAAALDEMDASDIACVVLDLTLPDSSGIDALTDLRGADPMVPIVVLTARDDPELAVTAIQKGAQDYLVKDTVGGPGLARAIRFAVERKRVELELLVNSMHDFMTGLPNRAMFLERLEAALARASRSGKKVAVMFVDLDRFKDVNDSLGHAAGDMVIVGAAHRLARCLRPSDVVARFGGDEFTIMCEDLSQASDVSSIVERIEKAMQRAIPVKDDRVEMSVSIGIAISDGGTSVEEILSEADHALYEVKARGGSGHAFFDDDLRSKVNRRRSVESDLRKALEAGELVVHYQDQIDVDSGRVTGVEALVRWEHPDEGLLGPSSFIGIAEAAGLIGPIGRRVMEIACEQTQAWRYDGTHAPDLRLSVNLSTSQLLEPDLAEAVGSVLESSGTDPALLCLEVTESCIARDSGRAAAAMKRLHDLGVRLSMDDFGTGYSSLSELKHLPLDDLKVDPSFVQAMESDVEASAISAAIIKLAHNMGLTATAEGIEEESQLRRLATFGCDYAQGYFLGRPYAA